MDEITIPYNFTPRQYQLNFLREIEKAINGKSQKRFFYLIWHRRSGKDKVAIADVVPRRLILNNCLVKYIYPTLVMGRDNLWNGIGSDGFRYINHIPSQLRLDEPNETRMTIKTKNIQGGESIFQVAGTNNPDSLRGGNPVLVVFSEWAEHDPYAWDVIEPILRENKGIAIFNTTPKGDNHARSLFEFAKNNDLWFVETLTYKDTGIFSEDEFKRIKEDTIKRFETQGRTDEEAIAYIEQEYLCSFNSPMVGSYYGGLIRKAEDEGRITKVAVENNYPVYTAWDLGIDDSTTIWFFQVVGNEFHFVDYFEATGEGLEFYIRVLQQKGYVYAKHFAPHDIQVRELGTGKSRWEIAKNLGITFEIAPRLSVEEGINAARMIFNRCWFDKDKCSRGIMALKSYRKDWDEKNKVFRKTPLHDWSSHGADAFRTFAVGFKKQSQPIKITSYGGVKPFYDDLGI
jgi:hypothetical protein